MNGEITGGAGCLGWIIAFWLTAVWLMGLLIGVYL